MGLDDLLGSGGGGDDEGGYGAQLEGDEGAVFEGEGVEGVVRGEAELVEVADDGEFSWARWEVLVVPFGVGFEKEEEEGEWEEEEEEEGGLRIH